MQLALPDNHVVQLFFETTGISDLLQTMHGIHLSVLERLQSEGQTEYLHVISAIQSKVELVEIGIISVYAVELLHAHIHNARARPDLRLDHFGGCNSHSCVCLVLLAPDKHIPMKMWRVALMTVLTISALAYYVWFVHEHDLEEEAEKHSTAG